MVGGLSLSNNLNNENSLPPHPKLSLIAIIITITIAAREYYPFELASIVHLLPPSRASLSKLTDAKIKLMKGAIPFLFSLIRLHFSRRKIIFPSAHRATMNNGREIRAFNNEINLSKLSEDEIITIAIPGHTLTT